MAGAALLLLLSLHAAPPAAPGADADPPSAIRLLFQAGELRRAIRSCQACIAAGGATAKRCKALLGPLVEYQAKASHADALTLDEARDMLAWDRAISPEVSGRLTREVVARYVAVPWAKAKAAAQAGAVPQAEALAREVLHVDPRHAEAAAWLDSVAPDAGAPARKAPRRGARDAGR